MQYEFFPFRIHEYLRMIRGTQHVASEQIETAKRSKQTTKTYARMPNIKLDAPTAISAPLTEALARRHGGRDYGGGKLSRSDVATLFGHALAQRPNERRPYPSGGALYPIETYLFVRDVIDVPSGIHHYNPERHALEHLWSVPSDFLNEIIAENAAVAWARNASALIVFTGFWPRNAIKYGDFGYYLAMLEAGHMAENLLLMTTAQDIAACPLGGFDDAAIARFIDIEHSRSEQPVYVIAIGPGPESSTNAENVVRF